MKETSWPVSFVLLILLPALHSGEKILMPNLSRCPDELCHYKWHIITGPLKPQGEEFNFIHKEPWSSFNSCLRCLELVDFISCDQSWNAVSLHNFRTKSWLLSVNQSCPLPQRPEPPPTTQGSVNKSLSLRVTWKAKSSSDTIKISWWRKEPIKPLWFCDLGKALRKPHSLPIRGGKKAPIKWEEYSF